MGIISPYNANGFYENNLCGIVYITEPTSFLLGRFVFCEIHRLGSLFMNEWFFFWGEQEVGKSWIESSVTVTLINKWHCFVFTRVQLNVTISPPRPLEQSIWTPLSIIMPITMHASLSVNACSNKTGILNKKGSSFFFFLNFFDLLWWYYCISVTFHGTWRFSENTTSSLRKSQYCCVETKILY